MNLCDYEILKKASVIEPVSKKVPYKDAGEELGKVKSDYNALLEDLTLYDIGNSPLGSLSKVIKIYSKVRMTKPAEGRETEWALDSIKVFKNLGYILEEIGNYLPKDISNTERKIMELEEELRVTKINNKTGAFLEFKKNLRDL